MLKANYHTHTKRCGHAIGEDEEYVLEAIGKGFRTLGFSDHAMFPTFSEPHVRGDYQQCFDDYISSINALRKKYSQKIGKACSAEHGNDEQYRLFALPYRSLHP